MTRIFKVTYVQSFESLPAKQSFTSTIHIAASDLAHAIEGVGNLKLYRCDRLIAVEVVS